MSFISYVLKTLEDLTALIPEWGILGSLTILISLVSCLYVWLGYKHIKSKDAPQGPILLSSTYTSNEGSESIAKRFVYKYATTPFGGRDTELKSLQDFVSTSKNGTFTWWMICGAGGSGKSRLALEFCKQLEKRKWYLVFTKPWDSGFTKSEDLHKADWDRWTPKRSTCIVIDYVAKLSTTRKDTQDKTQPGLAEIIDILSTRASKKPFRHPIRLLLLEREYKQQSTHSDEDTQGHMAHWYAELTQGVTSKEEARRSSCYNLTPLELPKLGETAIKDIAKNVFELYSSKKYPSDFLKKLQEIDPSMRALFAQMLAFYLANHDDSQNTSKEKVLDNILQRELAISWESPQMSRKSSQMSQESLQVLYLEKEALFQATITGKEWILYEGEKSDSTSTAEKESRQRLANHGLSIVDEDGNCCIRPFEPDILGEYCILQSGSSKEKTNKIFNDDELKAIVAKAWSAEPFPTAAFFSRCCQDFPEHPNLLKLLKMLEPKPNSPREDGAYGYLTVNVTALLPPDSGNYFYKTLSELGQSEEIMILRAKAAVSLIILYGKAGIAVDIAVDIAKVQKIYEGMESLGQSEEIMIARAEAAANLIILYAKVGIAVDIAKAQKIYEAMESLGQSEEIMILRAEAAVNLIGAYAKADIAVDIAVDIAKVQKIYEGMESLGQSEEIMILRAKAAIILILLYGKADIAVNIAEAQEIYKGMESLGKSEEIMILRAKAAVSLIILYGKAGIAVDIAVDIAKVQKIYEGMDKSEATTEYLDIAKEILSKAKTTF